VELHIDAIQHACAMQDLPAHERKQHISSDLIEFAGGLCEEILTSEKPMELIDKHARMLTKITGMDADNNITMDLAEFV
jgi:hypothetical protein